MVIQSLPKAVVDRIAAGEVIERPASVVKELVENALDAGATSIDVIVEEGGLDLIRVTDNGSGIDRGDLELAFASHATSKLCDVDDLYHIGSYGFRGEALSSIAAVSHATLTTGTDQAGEGWVVKSEGGQSTTPEPAAATRGTTIEIRNLFFNTPARRNFLASASAEAARCREVVTALFLCNTQVRFSFTSGGKKRFQSVASETLRDAIQAVYGIDFEEALFSMEHAAGGITVAGFATLPPHAKRRARAQQVFVNGRPVRDRAVASALRLAFKDFLPPGFHPSFLVHVGIDPSEVDVNVHPTKAEVRFKNRDGLFRVVRRAVRDALLDADLAPRVNSNDFGVSLDSPQSLSPGPAFGQHNDGSRGQQQSVYSTAEEGDALATPALAVPASPPAPAGEYLQLLDTYIVHASPEGMVLIDQHALHERILYARLQKERANGGLESQGLLVPETVKLEPSDYARAEARREDLHALGLLFDLLEPDAISITAVPSVLRHESLSDLVHALLDPPEVHEGIPDGLDRRLFTMACHAAIKAGDPLGQEDVASLIRQGEALEHDATCPHGRPTRVVITGETFERLFKRSGF